MKTSSKDRSGLQLLAAVLVSVFLVDNIKDVAVWVNCLDGGCDNERRIEAKNVGVLISSLIVFCGASYAALSGEKSRKDATLIIVGTFAGSLFSILKAAVGDAGYPVARDFTGPLAIWVICAVIFAMVFRFPVGDDKSDSASFIRIQRVTLTALLCFVVGTLWQIGVGTLAGDDSSRYFVVAPLAVAGAGGLCISAMLESWLDKALPSRGRLAVWITIGFCAASFYLTVKYWPDHSDGWIKETGQPAAVAAVMLTLLLSGLVISALVVAFRPANDVHRSLVIAGLSGAILAGIAGFAAGTLRQKASNTITDSDIWIIAVSHAGATLIAILGVIVSDQLLKRFRPEGEAKDA